MTATSNRPRGQRLLALPQGVKLLMVVLTGISATYWVARLVTDGPGTSVVVSMAIWVFHVGFWSSMWWVDRGRTAEPVASLREDLASPGGSLRIRVARRRIFATTVFVDGVPVARLDGSADSFRATDGHCLRPSG